MHVIITFYNQSKYNYYIANKGILEECDRGENVEVNGGCY
jgi:hypothetical protein